MLKSAGYANEPITFNWDITDRCQFDCSYCYNRDANQQKTILTTSKNAYKMVLAVLKNVDVNWRIEIQGGEPTLHPHLCEIVGELSDMQHCQSILIATNLNKPLSAYSTLIKKRPNVRIHMSYHPEYHSGWANRIVEYANGLGQAFFVEVILHPNPAFATDVRSLVALLTQHNVQFGVTLLHATEWFTPDYPTELLNEFKLLTDRDDALTQIDHTYDTGTIRLGEHEIYKRGISYRNMLCDARMFTIRTNGTIINTCTHKKQPLRLTSDVLHTRVVCPKNRCECSQMLRYKKDENIG